MQLQTSEPLQQIMLARYYGAGVGRFISADPSQKLGRNLSSPQRWNRFAYTLNNPVKFFDPNGLEEVTLTYRTFIPQSQVSALGHTYAGDNRGFSTAPDASSRTTISVRIETDAAKRPGNPIISQTSAAGPTRELNSQGGTIRTATATMGLPTATGSRDASGSAVINIQQDVKNPLSPAPQALTPGISANLTVTVSQDASSTQVTGTASQFPAEELNETTADGSTTAVMNFSPASGATAFSLLKPDRQVNEKK